MKKGRTLQELAAELDRQNAAKKDYIVDADAIAMVTKDNEPMLVLESGNALTSYGALKSYGITGIAHRQIGSYLGIPASYYDRMKAKNPTLLTENVNAWLTEASGSKRMLRTLDGNARALLSDRYRRIDNWEIASAVLPIIGGIEDARVESCELTDSRMYIKVVSPRTQAEVKVGDPVQAGVIVTNSEVGHGSVSVRPLIYRLVCSNGMVAASGAVRKYHIGRVNEANDDLSIFRDETIQASDKAFLMRLEDSVRADARGNGGADQGRRRAAGDRTGIEGVRLHRNRRQGHPRASDRGRRSLAVRAGQRRHPARPGRGEL